MQKKKGISLIVLVITIIVMIILAATVIISLDSGNIIEKANTAVKQTNKKTEKMEESVKCLLSLKEEPWNGGISESLEGSGTKEEPYLIKNGNDLAYLANRVNSGNPCTEEVYQLTNSINLANVEWTPIGYGGDTNADTDAQVYTKGRIFNGVLDGNNYVITGLKIVDENMQLNQGVGLVGVLDTEGVVKNIILYQGKVIASGMNGAIVGASRGTIDNCVNYAVNVETCPIYINEANGAGGIVGIVTAGTISNCKNRGEILTKNNIAGGIAGLQKVGKVANCENEGKITAANQQAGGIAGRIDAGEITSCKNSGEISTEKSTLAGGIVGWQKGGKVANCENEGKVTAATQQSGGIAGRIDEGKIENCENEGKVTVAKQQAGGIVGTIKSGEITNVTNKGEIYSESKDSTGISGGIAGVMLGGKITNAINIGKVTSADCENKIDCAGGIVGLMNSGNISIVYNRGYVNAEQKTGYIVGKKTDGTVTNTYYYKKEGNITGIGSDSGSVADVSGQTTLLLTPIFDTLSQFLKWIR